jgi:hypothetical protein
MNDMKFTTAGEYMEDHTWVLSPHGKQKHVAQWVVDNYEDRTDYVDNHTLHKWVMASKQILQDPDAVEQDHL